MIEKAGLLAELLNVNAMSKKESMKDDLHEACENVCNEKTFLAFIAALIQDREREIALEKANPSSPYDAGSLGWQNTTIEDFLGSALAWAQDSSPSIEQNNPWARAAKILYAGKIYE